MPFDFDELIDRHGTHSTKWDDIGRVLQDPAPDTIPMWVADMDFRSPPAVNEAGSALADHGVHGYFGDDSGYKNAMADWLARRHGWAVDTDWMTHTHGIVSALALSIQAFSEPGDGVVVFSPVYHMFAHMVHANQRRLIESPLKQIQGRYEMDLDGLKGQIDKATKIVLLCSPHNPGGRVWSAAELRALADFCLENDLILVSDEIHQDLVFEGAKHQVTATVAPQIMDRLITCVAGTKTFNIAGALTGTTLISNPEMREAFRARKMAAGLPANNRFGMVACESAYREGGPWLDALLPYLQGNRDRFDAFVAENLPGIRSMHLEATYLAWLDFSGTGLPQQEIYERIERKARIAINRGDKFGTGGENWVRFNFACPRARLDEALDRLAEAFA
ncbi:MalY/PatB family protein [Hwanghaeella sp.]|uniref:MalY/PatB family protein n=1 Tax=Hwanghaeella sp. TaxID=2605943 RepID=UPI003CCB8258